MARCPACGAENPDTSRHCIECGTALVASRQRREERKVVTSLFCDLVGFTAMSEEADPEDVDRVLRAYNKMARKAVEAHGGVVEKYIGDAVVAVFGVPAAHEDDAGRAVQAGLRIVQEAQGLRGLEAQPLRLRVGINTGEALVALDVDPRSGEGFLTGDAVNTASRLQSIAPPMGVAVGEETYQLTRDVFEYEALEPVGLKGKSRPVPVWLAKAARADLAAARRSCASFVGRDTQLAALKDLLRDCAESGSARSALVVGEPGIGKSRLVAEFGEYVRQTSDGVVWRSGRCLPYGEGVTFWALSEVVKAQAGAREDDGVDLLEHRLRRIVPDDADATWVRRRLRPLLGLDAPESSKEENFAAWRAFLRSLAAKSPAVIVFEDLHWADEAMVEFLAGTLATVDDVPLLIIATARPTLFERHVMAATLAFGRRLDLAPLDPPETGRLVASMLGVESAPTEVTRALIERCDGNPLFAEELVRLLDERGLLARDGDRISLRQEEEIPVSGSVQALIAARLDALPLDAKGVLADAAVVGRVFWAGAVAALGEREPADVHALLAGLADRQLVRRVPASSMRDEEEYGFWHAVIRDVAYGQLTRLVRARRHAAAAVWIEANGGARIEELAEILAHHCATALDLARAVGDGELSAALPVDVVRFSSLAGDRAMALDVAAAERFYRQALALTADGRAERSRLLARWGRSLLMTGRLKEAGEALEEAVAGLRAAGDDRAAAVAMRTWSVVLLHLDDARHEEVAAAAVELLEGRAPTPELVTALLGEVGVRAMAEDHEGILAAAGRAIELARELGLPEPAEAFGFRGGARCDLGDADGLDDYRHAIDVANAQGLAIEAANITCNLGVSLFGVEGPRAALAIHREGRASASRRSMDFLVRACRMQELDDLVWAGEWDEALEEAADLARRLESENNEFDLLLVWSQQLLIHGWRGRAAEVASLAQAVMAQVADTDQPVLAACGLVPSAVVRLALGSARDAAELLAACAAVPNVKGCSDYVCRLPEAVRLAVAAAGLPPAESLLDGVRPSQPLHEDALASARARLAEANGRWEEAAAALAAAASSWQRFGVPYEEAQARLGEGRCLTTLGRLREAEAALKKAGAIFVRLNAQPAVAATDAVLNDVAAGASG